MAKVLVVDDEPVVRELLRRSLQADGHVVVEGEDGWQAVDKYRDEKPDVVFLDVRMPRMDGIEALRRICRMDGYAKIIMLTALDDILLEQEARKAGALDFLRKGIGFEAFMAVARRMLDRVERGKGKEGGPLGRILVAEGEPSVRETLRSFLEGKGYEVETVEGGQDVLAKAKRYRPHVLIASSEMAGAESLGMLEELRNCDPIMGIIVTTTYPGAIRDHPALGKGGYDFIVKPLNMEYLETSVLTKIIMMIG